MINAVPYSTGSSENTKQNQKTDFGRIQAHLHIGVKTYVFLKKGR